MKLNAYVFQRILQNFSTKKIKVKKLKQES